MCEDSIIHQLNFATNAVSLFCGKDSEVEMTNRETVIKGLEIHLNELGIGKSCSECPYWQTNPCESHLIADAIALLKEQEAVKPMKQTEVSEWTVCGNCKTHIISKWQFCPYCGKAVKWE